MGDMFGPLVFQAVMIGAAAQLVVMSVGLAALVALLAFVALRVEAATEE
jgi:hypothetical protein